jgi:hypothetical protein
VSNQQSADPMVLVGPVEELQITIPVEKNLPNFPPKLSEKFLEALTRNMIAGTAVSDGREEAS